MFKEQEQQQEVPTGRYGQETTTLMLNQALMEWITERRSKMLRVSRKIIRKKALVLY